MKPQLSLIHVLMFAIIYGMMFMVGCNNGEEAGEENSTLRKEVYEQHPESDERAIDIALMVVDSMGGYHNWVDTRYLSWLFFGRRHWLWDKQTGDVRMKSLVDTPVTILMNIRTGKGKVYKGEKPVTHPDSLDKHLELGYRGWINDSYWLVMPFKLLDPGVTLRYKGERSLKSGDTWLLELTFDSVGVTPQNKYDVYVDQESGLVTQWSYYPTAGDSVPSFTTPWVNYARYGNIKLSGDRGRARLTKIVVTDTVNRKLFDELHVRKPQHDNNP